MCERKRCRRYRAQTRWVSTPHHYQLSTLSFNREWFFVLAWIFSMNKLLSSLAISLARLFCGLRLSTQENFVHILLYNVQTVGANFRISLDRMVLDFWRKKNSKSSSFWSLEWCLLVMPTEYESFYWGRPVLSLPTHADVESSKIWLRAWYIQWMPSRQQKTWQRKVFMHTASVPFYRIEYASKPCVIRFAYNFRSDIRCSEWRKKRD